MKIYFIKELNIKDNIVFLGTGGSMKPYIDNFQHVSETDKEIPFNAFLEQKKINMILVSDQLKLDTRFRLDKEFRKFLTEVPNDTWTEIDIRKCRTYLIVKKELLPDE